MYHSVMNSEKKYYIYKITLLCGSLAGHYYIGKKKLKKTEHNPMSDGYYGSGVIVKNYYKKYPFKQGITAIKEILELNETEEDNRAREKFYIGDKYDTDPMCLNLKEGGFGGVMSAETRKKMSEIRKGTKPWNTGIKLSESYKNKLSEVHKGYKWTDEQREKFIASSTGHICKKETRDKIAKSKEKPIIAYKYETKEYVGQWPSAISASKDLGIHKSAISMVIHGVREQVKGLIFKKVS